MRRVVLVLATTALAILLAGGVAQAIINGEPDRGPNAHPYVGMIYNDEFLCSGTLISPRVFLTAGHCTEVFEQGDSTVYVTFEQRADFKPDDAYVGTPHTHPKFCYQGPPINDPSCAPPPGLPAFPPNRPRYDVGVVVLNQPVRMATYGALPAAGLVDTLKKGQRFTTVGYGVRTFDPGGGERYKATVRLLDTKDPAIGEMFVKTTGAGLIQGKGETSCKGDSGGPLFVPDQQTIVGVTSFGIAPLCRGPGYYQRVDLPRVLKWVRTFP
jgi:hypothetical protein